MSELDQSEFTERVCTLLHEISQGHCSIDEADVDSLHDPHQQAVFTGLLMLHEEMTFHAEQREAAEQELRRRQQRQLALVDLAKVAIWDCDATGVLNQLRELGAEAARLVDEDDSLVRGLFEKLTINAVNREGLRMLGIDGHEALVARQHQLLDDESIPLFRELWKALAAGSRRVEAQGVLRGLDGTRMHVLVGVTMPSLKEGFTILTVADLTSHFERQEAERAAEEKTAELERINAEVERLFYAVSHDMRAPLRGVHNLAEWAIEDIEAGDAESVLGHMSALRGRVARLERMMNDLLTYARAGRVERAVEEVDLGALVDELPTLASVPARFAIVRRGNLPRVVTVRTLLTQVFLNLIGNAVKHHDKGGGEITIEAHERDGMIELRVSDDGPGIPIEYRERVFGLFSTLKPRDDVEGSGMGLAFVQKVVRSMGGHVSIVGPDGRGTTFQFTWPKTTAREPVAES